MVDSTSPVKLLPSHMSTEYGIGIHASAEDESLLVITPDAHVPHLDAWTGLWTRYDLSPQASLVSVQLADLKAQASRPPKVGGRYTSRTRVHFTTGTRTVESNLNISGIFNATQFHARDALSHIGTSCSLPSVSSCGFEFAAEPSWSCDWTYGRRFKGIVMGSPTTNVIATVLLRGTRAQAVTNQFQQLDALGKDGVTAHAKLGLHGDAHLALQSVALETAGNEGLVVARVGTEHREDMHRLLHHCLSPLEPELGVAPYGRMLKASKTARGGVGTIFAPPLFIYDPTSGSTDVFHASEEPSLHVQHGQTHS